MADTINTPIYCSACGRNLHDRTKKLVCNHIVCDFCFIKNPLSFSLAYCWKCGDLINKKEGTYGHCKCGKYSW